MLELLELDCNSCMSRVVSRSGATFVHGIM